MMKKIALAALASSLFLACGGSENNDDETCTLTEAEVCANKQCGMVQASDSCGNTKVITCGSGCDENEVCQNNMCIGTGPLPSDECVVSDEAKAQACEGKCGTVSAMNSCNEMTDVDCGTDTCGEGTVCNPNMNACVDPSECTLDLEAACEDQYGSKCGISYRVPDECGLFHDVDCGCDAEGLFVDSTTGEPIPGSDMVCYLGNWAHIDDISDFYIDRFCIEGGTGIGLNYCGELYLGLDSCGKPMSFTCPASNCDESTGDWLCSQEICTPHSICSGARDILTDWIGVADEPEDPVDPPDAGADETDAAIDDTDAAVDDADAAVDDADASVTDEDDEGDAEAIGSGVAPESPTTINVTEADKNGFAVLTSDRAYVFSRTVLEDTNTKYVDRTICMGMNDQAVGTLAMGGDSVTVDLSASSMNQNNHYDFVCDAGEGAACLLIEQDTGTIQGWSYLIYEAKSGTMTLKKSREGGVVASVNDAEMLTWFLKGDDDICSVPKVGFSINVASDVIDSLDCTELNDSVVSTLQDQEITAENAVATVSNGNKSILMEASVGSEANPAMLFVGVNSTSKLAPINGETVSESYIAIDGNEIVCATEGDSYGPGLCVSLWNYYIKDDIMKLTEQYEMVDGVIFVDSVKGTFSGEVKDARFQLDSFGTCAEADEPVSFSFSAPIQKK